MTALRRPKPITAPIAVLLALCCALLVCGARSAADTMPDAVADGQRLNRNVDWLPDADGRLTIDDVLSAQNQSRFEPSHGQSGVGLTSAAYWLRLRIEPPSGDREIRWLLVDPPYQEDLRLYFPAEGGGDGNVAGGAYHERKSGALVPFEQGRDLDFAAPAFRLPPFHDAPMLIYLRVQSLQGTAFELSLWHEESLRRHLQHSSALLNLLYGMVIGLLFYNLFLAISLRDVTYSAYVAMVCANLLFISHVNGDDFMYLWPDWPWMQKHCAIIQGGLWATTAGLFVLPFFSLTVVSPRLARIVIGYVLVQPVLVLMHFTGLEVLAAFLYYGSGLPWVSFLYGIGIYRLRKGFTPARYGLVGFSILIVGVIVYFLRLLGLVQPGVVSEHAIQVGTTFETLMFSLALAVRIQLLQQERDQALHDPLTGLLTRRLFDDRFNQACSLAQRQNAQVALMLIDLDRFKPINDKLGHDAGDAVLKAVAQRLMRSVRATDSVSRFGGDEFAIILNWPFDRDLPAISGQRIIKAVQEPIPYRNQSLQIGLSIGVAYWPEHGTDFATLYKAADRALYRAKEGGRGRLEIAQDERLSVEGRSPVT
jgi:diguanylate cyclase (GGDEF)-like protein